MKDLSNPTNKYELVTLYRGRDFATYLLEDFVELGENATPIFIRQDPSENAPFHKIKLQDTDGFYLSNPLSPTDVKV